MLTLALIIMALGCFLVAVFSKDGPQKVSMIGAGLAFWVLSEITAKFHW